MSRIRFANQLRGLAALCVAISHLIGVYWAMPDVVSMMTATLPQTGELPGLYWLTAHPWFNFGPFGVGVFFLISGFVIPFSLDAHDRPMFLLARALRIFPTYAAALLLEVAVIWCCAQLWNRPLPFTPAIVAGNVTLIYDLIAQPSIDLVNWTLSVELKFYVAMALLAPWIRRGRLWIVLAAGAAGLALNLAMAAGLIGDLQAPPSSLSYTASSHSVCLVFMLIGTLFNFHLRGRIRGPALVLGVAWLLACFVLGWQAGVWRGQYPIVTVNYVYALALFAALYAVRHRIPANPALDAMAAISFPFYLVHSLLGYIVLRTAMVWGGLGYYPALAITAAALLTVATLLHVAFERPTQALGRRLARHPPRPAPHAEPARAL